MFVFFSELMGLLQGFLLIDSQIALCNWELVGFLEDPPRKQSQPIAVIQQICFTSLSFSTHWTMHVVVVIYNCLHPLHLPANFKQPSDRRCAPATRH